MTMHETTDRLFEIAKEQGVLKPADIAGRLNISQQALKNWESRGIAAKALPEVARVFGVSETWLRTGEGSRTVPVLIDPGLPHEVKDIHSPMMWSSNDLLPEDDYTFVPYLKESCFKGGTGAYEIPDYNGYRLPFGKSTLKRKGINPDNVFCCTLTGDSMEERIAEDAAIAVDAGEKTIRDGKIYAFRHGDLFRVKYLSRLPGGRVKIKSHNPAYEDEEAGLEDIEVIGRVFWWSVLD